MSRRGWTAVYANLLWADYVRVKAFIGSQSVNEYVRGLISADLEDAGELPLLTLRERGRPMAKE